MSDLNLESDRNLDKLETFLDKLNGKGESNTRCWFNLVVTEGSKKLNLRCSQDVEGNLSILKLLDNVFFIFILQKKDKLNSNILFFVHVQHLDYLKQHSL